MQINWGALDPALIPEPLLTQARATWAHRTQTEHASITSLTRFFADVLAARDPIALYPECVRAIEDEVRHTQLCARVVEALGGRVVLPPPRDQTPEFLALPPAARALGTAVSMLVVNETISLRLIEDLHARCTHETIRGVLAATLADETGHGDFGVDYVRASLARFDAEGRRYAQLCAEEALAPHRRHVDGALEEEPELAALGLLGRKREAALVEDAITHRVLPRLRMLGLV